MNGAAVQQKVDAPRAGVRRWILLAASWLILAPAAPGEELRASSAAALAAPVAVEATFALQSPATDSTQLVTELDVDGLKVLVKNREGSQTVVAGLFLRGGAANVTAENAGIEALMLEVATEASENFPRERFRRELASMGTEISSTVGLDYSALVMSSTRLHFDRSWQIFTDAALHPSFTQEDFARVQNRMVVALRGRLNNPDTHLQILQDSVAYVGHPYANDPRGTAASVGSLRLEDVRNYHRDIMQKTRLLLVLVGDLDAADIQARVAETFGQLPRGTYEPTPVPPLSFDRPTVSVTPRNLPTNYVQGIYAAPSLSSPDYYAMRVATSILQSRVFTEVREVRNLSYAPDAFLWQQGANAGGIYVTAVDANQAVAVMLNEIARLQRERVRESTLEGTANHFLTMFYMDQQTNMAQAAELARYELIGGGWRNADRFLEGVRAVTPEDVQRVANTYMRNLQFVVLGDPRAIDETVFTGGVMP